MVKSDPSSALMHVIERSLEVRGFSIQDVFSRRDRCSGSLKHL
jgi:hypothetical protein